MQLLKDKIKAEGVVIRNSLLKVDSFLNHQIDPELMLKLGEEFALRFKDSNVTKVLTIESSGIAVAIMAGLALHVPVVFARKKKSAVGNDNVYSTTVYSFTKKESNFVTVSRELLTAGENIMIIDDFLANGEAALGLTNIVEQAGARVVGIGIVIEKTFQPGAEKLKDAGYRVESLVRIQSFSNGQVNYV
ncbi:MAG: xanthine phosphoribosyltransferase [Sporomusaceae bacterium]|nr:xanthine phosphoribosyltransferase [Sporomusaceae bacterium]